MERPNGNIYEFGDFRLIPDEGLLLRNGSSVPLTPKAFATLVILVERHGHLVEKTDLINRIWENAFVEEAAVSRCVWGIRNALGEDPQKKTFIQTVPKRGYRFVADVSVIAEGDEPANVDYSAALGISPGNGNGFSKPDARRDLKLSTTSVLQVGENGGGEISLSRSAVDRHPGYATALRPNDRTLRGKSVLGIRPIFAVSAVVLSIVGLLAIYFYSARQITSGDKNSVAVLPLKPVNVETRDSIYELGIADSVILKISSSRNLVVRPLNTVRKYVELDSDLIEIGKEQNVDFVLASNYQIANGKIKVTSQLLDVATGKVEDTFTVESESTDLFSAQDAIAGAIGSKLIARFGSTSTGYERTRGTNNEEAYRLYLQGMYLTEKYNRKDAARAIETFDEALRLDPTYAAAWAGKAHAHCNFAHRGGSAPIVEFANAEPALDKALALDENNADAYAVRGIINRDYHWNFAKAYANLDRALELNPNHIFARRIRSGLLTLDGRHDEAIIEIKKAIDLNPSWIWEHWLYAHALIQAKRYDEAIRQADRVLEMDPDFAASYSTRWKAYHLKGDHSKAYENFLRNKKLSGSSEVDIARFEAAFRDSGWFGVLRADRDARVAKLESDYSPAKYDIAGLSAVLGDRETALKYLNECLDNRLIGLSLIKVDPFLDGLRGDPRFEELVRKTGL